MSGLRIGLTSTAVKFRSDSHTEGRWSSYGALPHVTGGLDTGLNITLAGQSTLHHENDTIGRRVVW